jgi:hypothetical protein
VATLRTFGEADDPAVQEYSLVARAPTKKQERHSRWGLLEVIRRACGDNAVKMIQGDLVASRAVRGNDDRHAERVAGGP